MTPDKKNIENQVNEPQLAEYQLVNGLGLVNKNLSELSRICSSHHVQKLELFGSALKGPFLPKSDIDFMVRFNPIPLEDYFENYINLKISLENILERKVDLLEEQTLKNPYLIKSINQDKLRIYGE
jgi:uncharacterized protein